MKQIKPLPLGAKGAGLSFTAMTLINLILSILVSSIIALAQASETEAAKYVSYLVAPIAIVITLVLALVLVRQPAKEILPVKTHPKYYIIGLLLIFGLLFSLSWLNDYLVKLFELMGYTRREGVLPSVEGWNLLPALIVIAVLPAICEEIMFRGIILNNLNRGVGAVAAIFLSGMCFSLYHGSVEQTVYQFVCGCLFAFLSLRAKSLGPTVIMHFINNALILVLYACGVVDEATGALTASDTVQIILYVLSAVSLAGGIVWLVLDLPVVKSRIAKARAKRKLAVTANGDVEKASVTIIETPPCEIEEIQNKKAERKREVITFFITAAAGLAAMLVVWIAGVLS